jgi:hypothetical protein
MQEHMLLHTSHLYRITITSVAKNTVVSLDDGLICPKHVEIDK